MYNKLSLINSRELKWIPPHFSIHILADSEAWRKADIVSWIQSFLSCRFCVTRTPIISDNKITTPYVVALEDQTELTYFVLSCKYLRRN